MMPTRKRTTSDLVPTKHPRWIEAEGYEFYVHSWAEAVTARRALQALEHDPLWGPSFKGASGLVPVQVDGERYKDVRWRKGQRGDGHRRGGYEG